MFDLSVWLFKPLIIQGQKLVLIPDVVGSIPVAEQHEYVEIEAASSTCPAIHARESDIDEVRERFPGLPAYGIWQTLIFSSLVGFDRTLQVLTTSADDGYYLFCEQGRAQYSGVYEAGFFAADTSFDLQDAYHIQFDADQLRVPQKPAKLAKELQESRQASIRKAWTGCVATCLALVLFSVGSDFALDEFYRVNQKDYSVKLATVKKLKKQLQELKASRLEVIPNNRKLIEKFAEIWAVDPLYAVEKPSSFEQHHFTVVLSQDDEQLMKKLPWIRWKYYPEGYWKGDFEFEGEG